MISSQQIEETVKSVIGALKGRKREQAAFSIAAVCFSGGLALGKFVPEFKEGSNWIRLLQIAIFGIGAIAFSYGVIRLWRLANPIRQPPPKHRPSAMKGPMAFTEADGELFRRLGREGELQKLLGLVLDDQVLMIVVRGVSGAGKTSLLRAGLNHIDASRANAGFQSPLTDKPFRTLS